MDDFQKRAIGNHQRRHRDTIRRDAETIREYADYILRDLDQGRTSSHYAGDVVTAARAIVTRFAMLEAMGDVIGIIEASED
jgi:predicted DNA-binding ArsR family transcriptional regulator